MKTLCIGAMLSLAVAVASSGETTLGQGVRIDQATPIASLTGSPKDYVGKTVRIDGVAKAVCAEMGCWMAVAVNGTDPASPTVRLKVEEGVIVFPMSAKGKKVSAEGVFERVGGEDASAKEAAVEHARADQNASTQYQIKATGAVIR
ncbi:MAG: DUF4920 domain-containing protein [Acidobacteriota bacterium]